MAWPMLLSDYPSSEAPSSNSSIFPFLDFFLDRPRQPFQSKPQAAIDAMPAPSSTATTTTTANPTTAPVLCAELSPFWALVCDADASRDRVVMSRSGVGSACRAHLAGGVLWGLLRERGGRAVVFVGESVIDEFVGPGAAKVLAQGKAAEVEGAQEGCIYAECIKEDGGVAALEGSRQDGETGSAADFGERVQTPFKNENITAIGIPYNGKDGDLERPEDI
ncbi:uncharacterized protein THITE_2092140 [Thermothielavioides terrestris NRRL 8126]|uniref:Uncharacterized protein n=1 Tax=Thermothielavioides terrestris (strain ATCC 38088 / NRRL 8126) TaxID=578455 RepID=G2RCP5_THETT|nr:uncharacterized protein THITE_2092140 [Thermothielavioides terrestris NRRL 8126]AEO70641.1 hypothetical protein THITE_2092140 [Thermothielavioides terrestris NRRL 8126]